MVSATNAKSCAEAVATALVDEGAKYVFGVPGTSEMPFVREVCASSALSYCLCLHETAAVGIADGYARARPDELAVVNTHATQGTLNAAGYIRAALRDHTPMLLLAGYPSGGYRLHEPNHFTAGLEDLLTALTKWTWLVDRADTACAAISRGVTLAKARPTGPAVVFIPQDLWEVEVAARHVGSMWRSVETTTQPSAAAVDRFCQLLEDAQRPVLLAGATTADPETASSLLRFAETFNIPIVSEAVDRGSMMPAAPLPSTHPQFAGFFARHDPVVMQLLEQADLLITLGVRTDYPRVVGEWIRDSQLVQIDPDTWELAKNHPIALGIAASVGPTLDAVRSRCEHRFISQEYRSFADRHRTGLTTRERAAEAVMPDELASVLDSALPDDVLIVDDSQSFSYFLKHLFRFRRSGSLYGSIASHLGWGLPAAVGVQLARMSEPVVGIVSDMSFLLAPHALWTAARLKIPITIIVVNNGGFQSLGAELRNLGSARAQEDVTQLIAPPVDLASIAQGLGCAAVRANTARAIEAALSMPLAGPLVIDVICSSDPRAWHDAWLTPPPGTL